MRLLTDKKIFRGIDTLFSNTFYLLTENAGLDKHTIANEVNFVFMKNTAGDDMEHMFHAVELEGVTGIGATLKTSHHVIVRSQHIDNLTLAFVPPLQS